jgi:hypothetical protein
MMVLVAGRTDFSSNSIMTYHESSPDNSVTFNRGDAMLPYTTADTATCDPGMSV